MFCRFSPPERLHSDQGRQYGGEPEATPENARTVPDYVFNLKKSLVEAYAAVRETLGTHLQRQKDFYNRKVHGEPHKTGEGILSCYSAQLYQKEWHVNFVAHG